MIHPKRFRRRRTRASYHNHGRLAHRPSGEEFEDIQTDIISTFDALLLDDADFGLEDMEQIHDLLRGFVPYVIVFLLGGPRLFIYDHLFEDRMHTLQ
jgi:hypothetical protein